MNCQSNVLNISQSGHETGSRPHSSSPEKVGIMGGTFNPVHNGHLLLAETAREALGLDQVIFMPSGNSYMKDAASILDKETRGRMTELAIAGNPHFSFSGRELEREGPTYTCDTLAGLRSENPGTCYCLILGADNFFILEKWKNPEFIFQNCMIAVALRGEEGHGEQTDDIPSPGFRKSVSPSICSGHTTEKTNTVEGMAEYLRQKYRADIRLLPGRRMDLSSTEIRARLREGKSVRYMLPERVLEYINENGLYR